MRNVEIRCKLHNFVFSQVLLGRALLFVFFVSCEDEHKLYTRPLTKLNVLDVSHELQKVSMLFPRLALTPCRAVVFMQLSLLGVIKDSH